MAKATDEEIAEARETLMGLLSPGDTIYAQHIRSSSDGLTRIRAFFVVANGGIANISQEIATVLGKRYSRSDVYGNGLDTGYDDGTRVVQLLGRELYGSDMALHYHLFS